MCVKKMKIHKVDQLIRIYKTLRYNILRCIYFSWAEKPNSDGSWPTSNQNLHDMDCTYWKLNAMLSGIKYKVTS